MRKKPAVALVGCLLLATVPATARPVVLTPVGTGGLVRPLARERLSPAGSP
jgi:hypothetical protein